MRIDVLTLFPEMFAGVFGSSIIKRARENGILSVNITDFREFAEGRHRQADDSPFGGGSGMVLKPEPLFFALRHLLAAADIPNRRIIITDPAGEKFTQKKAKELATYDRLIFICGHYEGFDARIFTLADEKISVGDFVLTGGELPAMTIIDATARMIPGVLGSPESPVSDSFYDGLLGYPQYTRPREFEGMSVPEVLLNGNHAEIARWRRKESLRATQKSRPDLLAAAKLTDKDRELLREIAKEESEGVQSVNISSQKA